MRVLFILYFLTVSMNKYNSYPICMYPAEGLHISTFPKVDAKADCLDSRRVCEGITRLCA